MFFLIPTAGSYQPRVIIMNGHLVLKYCTLVLWTPPNPHSSLPLHLSGQCCWHGGGFGVGTVTPLPSGVPARCVSAP